MIKKLENIQKSKNFIQMKNVRKYFIAILLIFCSFEVIFAQNNNSYEPWFFIQLTDPQFGMFENNESFDKETALFEKAVIKINRLRPDFVAITGDFVHNQKSEEQIAEFKRIASKKDTDIPVYYTPGNHDVGQIPDKESLKKYKKNYGSDKFSFKHKGVSFIGFNTSYIKAKQSKQEEKQFKWLTKKLKQNKDANHIILFCHYPFFNKTIDEPEAYSNIGIEYREKYLQLFDNYGVDAIFNGHYHNNGLASYGNIQLVTTSALGKPLGKAPSGFRIITVSSEGLKHQYFGLDNVPESINFE